MRFIIATLALFYLPFALCSSNHTASGVDAVCHSPHELSSSNVGEHHNVKMTTYSCAETAKRDYESAETHSNLTKRALNVCGATCDTHCFNPAGGGPDPNDCNVIADALRYDSQNIGNVFNIPTNAAVIRMQYRSCLSFFVNQAKTDLQYCRADWASVLDYVAFNCQATQNAHGGLCAARSQQWFIQIQHS